jgi:hypothetical protein
VSNTEKFTPIPQKRTSSKRFRPPIHDDTDLKSRLPLKKRQTKRRKKQAKLHLDPSGEDKLLVSRVKLKDRLSRLGIKS